MGLQQRLFQRLLVRLLERLKSVKTAAEIIEKLQLQRHPEGGWYRETWRHDAGQGQRGAGTAIYFLLEGGERSAWHRVDAAEIWHFYAGAPLRLVLSPDLQVLENHKLGPDVLADEHPQVLVPPHVWQRAESLGEWTLVGCTVSPAFQFEHFELAPDVKKR